ncbi:MAG: type II toxin-antitoxin system PemK/MazF family toxin [Nitrospirae bacterium]|nr:type II toxin-antitoxin system PemK/MazF family toxin [Nitrospirota bacterium]
MTFDAFDVVAVPFPFVDRNAQKRRPALVLSGRGSLEKVEHSVLAMITSRKNPPWPLDVPVSDGAAAGLTAPSVVRMKLFTLDNRLVVRKIGRLSTPDRIAVQSALGRLLVLEATG